VHVERLSFPISLGKAKARMGESNDQQVRGGIDEGIWWPLGAEDAPWTLGTSSQGQRIEPGRI